LFSTVAEIRPQEIGAMNMAVIVIQKTRTLSCPLLQQLCVEEEGAIAIALGVFLDVEFIILEYIYMLAGSDTIQTSLYP
jgi:hypothetical protein